jgi:hypothetical protein
VFIAKNTVDAAFVGYIPQEAEANKKVVSGWRFWQAMAVAATKGTHCRII